MAGLAGGMPSLHNFIAFSEFGKMIEPSIEGLWWAHKGSNLGPLPCEGNALPLSYAPGTSASLEAGRPRRIRSVPAIYEVGAVRVKLLAGGQ
jgi:hypothetical protein